MPSGLGGTSWTSRLASPTEHQAKDRTPGQGRGPRSESRVVTEATGYRACCSGSVFVLTRLPAGLDVLVVFASAVAVSSACPSSLVLVVFLLALVARACSLSSLLACLYSHGGLSSLVATPPVRMAAPSKLNYSWVRQRETRRWCAESGGVDLERPVPACEVDAA